MQLKDSQKLVLILILGLLIHVSFISLIWGIQRANISRDSKLKFEEDTSRDSSTLLSYLDSYNHVLYGLRGFVTASEKITRQEWDLYTKSLNVFETYPGLKGLSYFPYITSKNKDQFTKDIRKEYSDIISKVEPNLVWGNKDYYVPLQFMLPEEPMQNFIGSDYSLADERGKAIEMAIESGVSVATPTFSENMIRLAGVEYIIFLPIYKQYQPIDTLEQRKANIMGLVALGLDIDELIHQSYLRFDNEFDIYLEVLDVTDPSQKISIAHEGNPSVVDGDDNTLLYNISLGGRKLEFQFAAEQYYRTNLVMVRNTDVFFITVLVLGIIALIITYRIVSIRRLKSAYDI